LNTRGPTQIVAGRTTPPVKKASAVQVDSIISYL